MKEMLFKYGFGYVWENGGVGDEKLFCVALRQRLRDCFVQDWDDKIHTSERFSTYCQFKLTFESESYLTEITIKKFRDILIRFRLGIVDINGNNRYKNVYIKNCPFCKNVTEDEEHFLLYCVVYKDIRCKYLRPLLTNGNDQQIMQSQNNTEHNRKLAMYIFYALKLRESRISAENV